MSAMVSIDQVNRRHMFRVIPPTTNRSTGRRRPWNHAKRVTTTHPAGMQSEVVSHCGSESAEHDDGAAGAVVLRKVKGVEESKRSNMAENSHSSTSFPVSKNRCTDSPS